jgi:hypothetical protein
MLAWSDDSGKAYDVQGKSLARITCPVVDNELRPTNTTLDVFKQLQTPVVGSQSPTSLRDPSSVLLSFPTFVSTQAPITHKAQFEVCQGRKDFLFGTLTT